MNNVITKILKSFRSVCIVIVLFLFVAGLFTPALAGGGRFRLESYSSPGFTGSDGIHIQAWLLTSGQGFASVGEHAEFRIQNPRTGDRCDTTTNITTNNGQIFGVCFAAQAGQMLVYVHSNDKNEDSSPMVIYFYDKPAPTPTPTRIPTRIPTATPTPVKLTPTVQNVNTKPTIIIQRNNFSPTPIPSLVVTPNSMTAQIKTESFFGRVLDFLNNILSILIGR